MSFSNVSQALIFEDNDFKHILRILNTNVDGKNKVAYALTAIKGVGRRFSNLICKRARIDLNKRYVFSLRQFRFLLPFIYVTLNLCFFYGFLRPEHTAFRLTYGNLLLFLSEK